jgi:hypothetical protein
MHDYKGRENSYKSQGEKSPIIEEVGKGKGKEESREEK